MVPGRLSSITVFTLHTAKQFFTGSISNLSQQSAVKFITSAFGSAAGVVRLPDRLATAQRHLALLLPLGRGRGGINICLRRRNNRILLGSTAGAGAVTAGVCVLVAVVPQTLAAWTL